MVGVVAAPFLHDGFGHLAGNTVPFLALGFGITVAPRANGKPRVYDLQLAGGGASTISEVKSAADRKGRIARELRFVLPERGPAHDR